VKLVYTRNNDSLFFVLPCIPELVKAILYFPHVWSEDARYDVATVVIDDRL